MVLMAFLTRALPPRALDVQDFSEHDTHMRAGSCGRILLSLPQRMHKFVRGIKIEGLVEGTLFDPLLFL